jgi:hypothetical protein
MRGGLRPILVSGRRFRWRFNGRVVVIPAERSGPQLYVEWGWKDWLEPEGQGNSPMVVSPDFVAAAVLFALGSGWEPEGNKSAVVLGYSNGSFCELKS